MWPPPTQEQRARGGHVTTVALATTAESLDSEQKFVCKITSALHQERDMMPLEQQKWVPQGSMASWCEMLFCRVERLDPSCHQQTRVRGELRPEQSRGEGQGPRARSWRCVRDGLTLTWTSHLALLSLRARLYRKMVLLDRCCP